MLTRPNFRNPSIHLQQYSNIKEGDWVWIEGVRGRIRMKAELFRRHFDPKRKALRPKSMGPRRAPQLPGEEPWTARSLGLQCQCVYSVMTLNIAIQ